MSYNPITENLSYDYQPNAISSNTTIGYWRRQLFDVIATSGNITITLPPNSLRSNTLEMGSIFLRRLDTVAANTVTVVAVINGVMQNIKLPVGTDVVHQFTSVYDGDSGSNTFYFQQSSANVLNQTRVARFSATTSAVTNIDVNATNYIGLNVGGWTLSAGDSILAGSQTNNVESAVYVVQNGGGLARRDDFALGCNVNGYLVPVEEGTYSRDIYIFYNQNSGQSAPAIAGYDRINVALYVEGQNPLLTNDYEKFIEILDQDYTAFPTDAIIICNLVSGVNRTLTLPKLSSLLNPSTANLLKIYQIFKLAPSGVLTVSCTSGDTFGDGTTSTTLQKNGDNIYLTGIISSTNSFWLIG
jgi:hypothetical protein